MTSDEIRARFLEFFEQRDHARLRSASLVPAAFDPSVLLTTAGMHPLMPYFRGLEQPPQARLTSCQKCFRTPDLEQVGLTARHLTFFEMLGNFSLGDYFKQGAIEFAWEVSREVFGFDPERIWITVFAGDEELGLDADAEAIEAWLAAGVPRERIVPCPRSENFWQAGPTGPCGPCSELYLDRGVEFGSTEDLPGGENERFLEYWNLVFMQYDQQPAHTLTALPANNIDTGLGLNRLAAILQDTPTVFETDQFKPLIDLGEELSGRRYGSEPAVDRALRVLADHARGMCFLVADGVVPSNEDRGYVLRRIMRRAIQQGRSLGCAPGFLPRYAATVRELMAVEYPELAEQRDSIDKWLADEEANFGRTLEQGLASLRALIDARSTSAQDIFKLHDTFGFPFELSKELLEEHGLAVDEAGFAELMAAQRVRSRAGTAAGPDAAAELRARASAFAGEAGFTTRFTGYEQTEQATTVGALDSTNGKLLIKLAESPFYAAGGGQVSDAGSVGSGEVVAVLRVGDDQVLVVAPGAELSEGERVLARVDLAARRATECNHTATHLLQAALRARLGPHVRQAGSYVGPDKLRFDFSHSHGLSGEELADVEEQVNAWILENHPVRPIVTTLDEAKKLGAMALFGEKYGEIVRMVQVGDGSFSRELCGGTHVRSTAEIGVIRVLSETSSAANVRRIEALTGPAAIALLRSHDRALVEVAGALRSPPGEVAGLVREREQQRRELERGASRAGAPADLDVEHLAAQAELIGAAAVLCQQVEVADGKLLLDVVDRVKGKLGGDGVIVLGGAADGRALLVVSVAPALVARGLAAGAIVKAAALVVGGGGGGRDTLAQAGGRDPAKLPEALATARRLICEVLSS